MRPPRYSFVANVDLTDLQSETGTRGQIVDLLDPIRRDDKHSARAISSLPLWMN
jgi:hypothetical protein